MCHFILNPLKHNWFWLSHIPDLISPLESCPQASERHQPTGSVHHQHTHTHTHAQASPIRKIRRQEEDKFGVLFLLGIEVIASAVHLRSFHGNRFSYLKSFFVHLSGFSDV